MSKDESLLVYNRNDIFILMIRVSYEFLMQKVGLIEVRLRFRKRWERLVC